MTQSDVFISSWRSLGHWKGHLTIPQRLQRNARMFEFTHQTSHTFFSDVFLWNDFANAQRGYCSWVKRFSTSRKHLIWCWWVSNGYRCVLFATSFCDEDTKKRSCTAYTSLHVVYKSSGSRTNSIQDASLAPSTPTHCMKPFWCQPCCDGEWSLAMKKCPQRTKAPQGAQ